MLKGKIATLKVAEKEDAKTLSDWFNNPEFSGDFQHFPVQLPSAQIERRIMEQSLYGNEWVDFIVRDSGEREVGWASHYTGAPNFGWPELGVAILLEHRNKGYGSEAVALLTDYLFLSREIGRVQAIPDVANVASVRIFEKSNFRKEGILRMFLWNRNGTWGDGIMLSITRQEWKQPKALIR